jgi:hypothetical protein
MPTASTSMIDKLAADGKVMSDALDKMQAALSKLKKPASQADLDKLVELFGKFNPRILKYAREVKQEPPIYAGEDDYKLVRKLLTAAMAQIPKVAKLVEADKKRAAAGPLEFKVDPLGAKEILKSKALKLDQALEMVAIGEKGRSGPADKDVEKYSHIHIGGNAKQNLIFRPGKKLVLGILPFHLDNKCSKEEKEQIKEVAGRSGSPKTFVLDEDGFREK